jgi:hypothetical protein
MRQAIAAYEAALQEFTRERAPLEWAATQKQLGDALRVLGEFGDEETMRRAMASWMRWELGERHALLTGRGIKVLLPPEDNTAEEDERLAAALGMPRYRGEDVAEEDERAAAGMDTVLQRLDQGIAAENVAMDRLLERIASRTPQ